MARILQSASGPQSEYVPPPPTHISLTLCSVQINETLLLKGDPYRLIPDQPSPILLIFGLLSLMLAAIFVFHFVMLVYDILHRFQCTECCRPQQLELTNVPSQSGSRSMSSRIRVKRRKAYVSVSTTLCDFCFSRRCCCSCVEQRYGQLIEHPLFIRFNADGDLLWVTRVVVPEILESLLQFVAFLEYGGMSLQTNRVVLAIDPKETLLFASVLGSSTICIGSC